MKLIIDIPEEYYDGIRQISEETSTADMLIIKNGKPLDDELKEIWTVIRTVWNGTPIPDNATNGDVIKAMFPNTEVDDYDYGKDPVIDVYGIDDTEYITLRKAWWNSPYQKGGKE